jgi:hypothetical protein
MKHLSEEELVEHYFAGPGSRASRIAQRHMDACEECATGSVRLAEDLNAMRGIDVEKLSADYGESVWSRVSVALPPRPVREVPVQTFASRLGWHRGWTWNRGWVLGLSYAAACAVLVLTAFQIGRMWEHRQHSGNQVAKLPAPVQRQVVVVVLGDHLDRTERLLVELKHADGEDAEVVKPLREEARSLLAANRVFKEDADKSDDVALQQALDHLDHLLNDVANEPGGMNAASIARLQNEMKADGLLFEVRVLRSRTPHRETAIRVPAKGGTA